MSSHHIVKEDQEPALIIAHIDGVTSSVLDQLLEWNPIVITNTHNLSRVVQQGVKIDVLVANGVEDLPQDHILVLPKAPSFLEAALAYLTERRCRAANIVSMDADPNLILRYANNIHTVLLGNGKRIFAVTNGFSKWRPKGETVFLFDDHLVETRGLRCIRNNEYITETDGFYSIYFDEPHLLIGEPL